MRNLYNTNTLCAWQTPPKDIRLHENSVDIWLTSLDIEKHSIDKLTRVLSEDEIKRAGRFHSIDLKNNFITARAVLRFILARYLKVSPVEIIFHYDTHGKPLLTGEFLKSGICFNLSHTHGMVLYGITFGRAVGVDIEKIRLDYSFEKIAGRHFAPSEFKLFQKSPENEKIRTFFTYWTRKESILKALGKGLHLSMKTVDVSGAPREAVKFLDNSVNLEKTKWFIGDLNIGRDYCAAFAVEGMVKEKRLYLETCSSL